MGTLTIDYNNQTSLFLATNPIRKARSRHLEVDCHFGRELVE